MIKPFLLLASGLLVFGCGPVAETGDWILERANADGKLDPTIAKLNIRTGEGAYLKGDEWVWIEDLNHVPASRYDMLLTAWKSGGWSLLRIDTRTGETWRAYGAANSDGTRAWWEPYPSQD